MYWYFIVLKKFTDFTSRASRSEYWYFILFNIVISILCRLLDSAIGNETEIIGFIYSLAVILPSIAVTTRRLHDTGRSGWWQLIGLIPIIGWIVLFVWVVTDSNPEVNLYGENPKKSFFI
jgi:uncharacterized membrane protein YhaH (DUF805 family)